MDAEIAASCEVQLVKAIVLPLQGRVRIEIPLRTPNDITELRRCVIAVATGAHMGEDAVTAAGLAVAEIGANALLHGKKGCYGIIYIRDSEPCCLEIIVADSGRGIARNRLSLVTSPRLPCGQYATSGRGWYLTNMLISQNSGQISLATGRARGTVVHMLIPLRPDAYHHPA